MTPRRRAILIVALAVLLLGLIIAAIVLLTRNVAAPTTQPELGEAPTDVEEPPVPVAEFVNPLIPPAPVQDDGRTEGRQIAELFAERYGSYSNQGDYQNLRDLLTVMTVRYRAETEAFLESVMSTSDQPYEGVTSKKVSTDVREIDADSAVIAVSLQQEKVSATAATEIGYRTLRMELRKVGDDWLVDRVAWEN